MKKILFYILLIIALSANSQSINVVQDLKLATTSDNYGNKPFTTDIVINAYMVYPHREIAGISFEYANLHTNYYRISQTFGYRYIKAKQFTADITANIGVIYHNGWNFGYYDISHQFSIKVSKKLKAVFFSQYAFRPDIEKFRLSTFIGIGYEIR